MTSNNSIFMSENNVSNHKTFRPTFHLEHIYYEIYCSEVLNENEEYNKQIWGMSATVDRKAT